jgi:hypothetical protein
VRQASKVVQLCTLLDGTVMKCQAALMFCFGWTYACICIILPYTCNVVIKAEAHDLCQKNRELRHLQMWKPSIHINWLWVVPWLWL